MAEPNQQQHRHHGHSHSHRRKDGATRFKERSLRAIAVRRSMEKWLKAALCIVAALMVAAVAVVYVFG